MMKRSIPFVLILCSLLFAAVGVLAQDLPTKAPVDPSSEERAPEERAKEEAKVRVLLSGYDYFPTRDELLAVSPDVVSILIAIYQDPEAIPSTRLRVIDALGYFDTDETSKFFTYLLDNHQGLASRELHHAITAYTKAFRDRSLDLSARFLDHSDAQIRITAAVALQKHVGAAARPLIEARIKVEPSAVVREKLEASK